MAGKLQQEHPAVHLPPARIVSVSAESGAGVDALVAAITSLLGRATGEKEEEGVEEGFDDVFDESEVLDWDTSLPDGDGLAVVE
jgi:hypothetical protein